MGDQPELAAGQLRRHIRLGTEAVYRVRSWDASTVRVEVVQAPGLPAGQEYRFTLSSVLAMPLADHGTEDQAMRR